MIRRLARRCAWYLGIAVVSVIADANLGRAAMWIVCAGGVVFMVAVHWDEVTR